MHTIALVVLLAATSIASQPPAPPAPDAVSQVPPRRAKVYFYICPKDETMVRVPHSKFTGDLKCPVDGTVMKPGLGQRSAIFLLQ